MSNETVCDVCENVCGKRTQDAKTVFPLRYKVYEFIRTRGDWSEYEYVEKDLCETCRYNLEVVLEHVSNNDMTIYDLTHQE